MSREDLLSKLVLEYTESSDDGNETEAVEMEEVTQTIFPAPKKPLPANCFMTLYEPTETDKMIDQMISMLMRKQTNPVLINLSRIMWADPKKRLYEDLIYEIKRHGTPDMKLFAKTYMSVTSTTKLGFYNKLTMETCINTNMSKRDLRGWGSMGEMQVYHRTSLTPIDRS
jgi:hypothetical protein